MPRLSFIIPVLNEGRVIDGLLRRLRAHYPSAELLVVDGGSADDTVARAAPLCDRLLTSVPGRALQMNCGAGLARGDYLLFLHADSVPTASPMQLDSLLASEPSWGFCLVRLDGKEWVYRCIGGCMNWRSRLTRIATGDQMLFVRRDVFRATGGFDPIPLMEDVAYCKRLRIMAPPLIIPQPVQTSSRRWRSRGVLRTVLQMWGLRLAYFFGVSPQRLWRSYYGRG